MPRRAPIVLFTFNRPEHTRRTLEALAANDLASESHLTVYCDGPRRAEDVAAVDTTRAVVRAASGFASVQVVARDANMGLARSVISGVTTALEANDSVIVLEDDMLTSPSFLRFMNDGLTLYRDEDRVIAVCGYVPQLEREMPDTFFLPGTHCWGWGTWRRGWALFEPDPAKLRDAIVERDRIYEFDVQDAEPLTMLLQRSALGDPKIDSWALRWLGSAILHDKLTLYPGRSLLANTGFDGSGTHGATTNALATTLASGRADVERIPIEVSAEAMNEMRRVLLGWRTESSPRERALLGVLERLPGWLQRRLYTWRTLRILKTMGFRRTAGGRAA